MSHRDRKDRDAPSAPSDGLVGYRRPPEEHRFKPGHRGNPWGCKGRPKPPRDFLDERQRVRIEGKMRWVTRDELIDHALYKEAIGGNVSAVKQLEARQKARLAKRGAEGEEELTPERMAALERAVLRKARDDDPSDDDADDAEERA